MGWGWMPLFLCSLSLIGCLQKHVLESDELQLAIPTEEILQLQRENDLLDIAQNKIWILDLRLNFPKRMFMEMRGIDQLLV